MKSIGQPKAKDTEPHRETSRHRERQRGTETDQRQRQRQNRGSKRGTAVYKTETAIHPSIPAAAPWRCRRGHRAQSPQFLARLLQLERAAHPAQTHHRDSRAHPTQQYNICIYVCIVAGKKKVADCAAHCGCFFFYGLFVVLPL